MFLLYQDNGNFLIQRSKRRGFGLPARPDPEYPAGLPQTKVRRQCGDTAEVYVCFADLVAVDVCPIEDPLFRCAQNYGERKKIQTQLPWRPGRQDEEQQSGKNCKFVFCGWS